MAALTFASALAFAIAVKAQVVAIDATSHPSGLSAVLSPSYAGMGIEPSNIYSFTGGILGRNDMTYNCLANLAGYSGAPPHLRIGGNTGDNILYNGTIKDWNVVDNPNPVGIGAYPSDRNYVGPTFFEGINRFPTGTPITFGLNLAFQGDNYIARIVEQAATAVKQFTNVKLVSFEVGNEPDLYLQNGFRTAPFNGSIYASEWTERTAAVYDQVLRPNGIGSNFFEPACTANTIGTTFRIEVLDETMLMEQANASSKTTYISQWNQHNYFYYIGVSGYTLTLNYLMDLSQTPAQFAAWVAQIGYAHASGYQFALREMASVGPIGQPGISDTFGATLWQLNFFLYTATLNVTSVQMHMTDNSYAAPWQPLPNYNLAPYVRSTYYAWAAMTQIIGKGCTTRVAALNIGFPQNYANRLGAYATYQNDALASVVLLNTLQSNASVSNKNYVTFNVSFPGSAGKQVYLSYLTAEGADSTQNTTWNGINYEQSGDCSPTVQSTTMNTTTVDQYGFAQISVRDSQAVVANLGSVVGSGAYNSAACSAIGLTQPAATVSVATSIATATPTVAGGQTPTTAIAGVAAATTTTSATKKSAGVAVSASSTVFSLMAVVMTSLFGGMFLLV